MENTNQIIATSIDQVDEILIPLGYEDADTQYDPILGMVYIFKKT